MADFNSTIVLKANTQGLERKMKGVTESLSNMNDRVREASGRFIALSKTGVKSLDKSRKSVQKLGNSFSSLSSKIKTAATAAEVMGGIFTTVLVGKGLASATAFEKGMSAVKAVTNASESAMSSLNKEALRLGSSTKFTAGEASDAMLKLSMAGFSADETLKATKDTLALASAGAMDLGESADIASNVLAGFSLKVKDLGMVTDVMAKAAASSNTSVSELGFALSYVGPVAEQSSLSIQDTVAAIGKLSDAGIKGTRAGTNVRAMLLRLQSPSVKAAKKLNELGISTRDAQGDFKPFISIMKEFGEATQDAGDFAEVFGRVASSGAGVLAKAAVSGEIQSLGNSLRDANGAAKDMSSLRMDNLAGSITLLTSAWDGLMQVLFQGTVLDTIRLFIDDQTQDFIYFTKVLKDFKNSNSDIWESMKSALRTAGVMFMRFFNIIEYGPGYVFQAFYIGMLNFVKKMNNAATEMRIDTLLLKGFNKIKKGFAAIGTLMLAYQAAAPLRAWNKFWIDGLTGPFVRFSRDLKSIVYANTVGIITGLIPALIEGMALDALLAGITVLIKDWGMGVGGILAKTFMGIWLLMTAGLSKSTNFIIKLMIGLNYLMSDTLSSSFDSFGSSIKRQKGIFDEWRGSIAPLFGFMGALKKAFKKALGSISDGGTAKALKAPFMAIKNAINDIFEDGADSFKDFRSSFTDSSGILSRHIESTFHIVLKTVKTIGTIGRQSASAFKEMFTSLVDISWDIREGVVKAFQSLWKKLIGNTVVWDIINDTTDAWKNHLWKPLVAMSWSVHDGVLSAFSALRTSLAVMLSSVGPGMVSIFTAISDTSLLMMGNIHSSFTGLIGLSESLTYTFELLSITFGQLFGGGVTNVINTAVKAIKAESVAINKVGVLAGKASLITLPIVLVMNWKEIWSEMKRFVAYIREGEVVKALQVMAGGLDVYVTNMLRGITTLVVGIVKIISMDMTKVMAAFPRLAKQIKKSWRELGEVIEGVTNGLMTGIAGSAFGLIFDTIRTVISLLTNFDSTSIFAGAIAAWGSFKLVMYGAKKLLLSLEESFLNLFTRDYTKDGKVDNFKKFMPPMDFRKYEKSVKEGLRRADKYVNEAIKRFKIVMPELDIKRWSRSFASKGKDFLDNMKKRVSQAFSGINRIVEDVTVTTGKMKGQYKATAKVVVQESGNINKSGKSLVGSFNKIRVALSAMKLATLAIFKPGGGGFSTRVGKAKDAFSSFGSTVKVQSAKIKSSTESVHKSAKKMGLGMKSAFALAAVAIGALFSGSARASEAGRGMGESFSEGVVSGMDNSAIWDTLQNGFMLFLAFATPELLGAIGAGLATFATGLAGAIITGSAMGAVALTAALAFAVYSASDAMSGFLFDPIDGWWTKLSRRMDSANIQPFNLEAFQFSSWASWDKLFTDLGNRFAYTLDRAGTSFSMGMINWGIWDKLENMDVIFNDAIIRNVDAGVKRTGMSRPDETYKITIDHEDAKNGMVKVVAVLDKGMKKIWNRIANEQPKWLSKLDPREKKSSLMKVVDHQRDTGSLANNTIWGWDKEAEDAVEFVNTEFDAAREKVFELTASMDGTAKSSSAVRMAIAEINKDFREGALEKGIQIDRDFQVMEQSALNMAIAQRSLNKAIALESHWAGIVNTQHKTEREARIALMMLADSQAHKKKAALEVQRQEVKSFKERYDTLLEESKLSEKLEQMRKDAMGLSAYFKSPQAAMKAMKKVSESLLTTDEKRIRKLKEVNELANAFQEFGAFQSGGVSRLEYVLSETGELDTMRETWSGMLEDSQADLTEMEELTLRLAEAEEIYAKKLQIAKEKKGDEKETTADILVLEKEIAKIREGTNSQIGDITDADAVLLAAKNKKIKDKENKDALAVIDDKMRDLNLSVKTASTSLDGLESSLKSSILGIEKEFLSNYKLGWKKRIDLLDKYNILVEKKTAEHYKKLQMGNLDEAIRNLGLAARGASTDLEALELNQQAARTALLQEESLALEKGGEDKTRIKLYYSDIHIKMTTDNAKAILDIKKAQLDEEESIADKRSDFMKRAFAGSQVGLNLGLEADLKELKRNLDKAVKEINLSQLVADEVFRKEKLALQIKYHKASLKFSKKGMDGVRVAVSQFFDDMKSFAELMAEVTTNTLNTLRTTFKDVLKGKDVDFKQVFQGIFQKFQDAMIDDTLNTVLKGTGLEKMFGIDPEKKHDGSAEDKALYVQLAGKSGGIAGGIGGGKDLKGMIKMFKDSPFSKMIASDRVASAEAGLLQNEGNPKAIASLKKMYAREWKKGLAPVLKNGWEDMTEGLSLSNNGLFEGLGKVFSGAWEGLSGIFGGLMNGLASLFNGGGGGSGGGGGGLGGLFGSIAGGIGSLFGGGDGGLTGGANTDTSGFDFGFGGGADTTTTFAMADIPSTDFGAVAMSTGGSVRGAGTGTSDSIPAMLSNGEYVVNAAATARHGGILSAINGGSKISAFAEGGMAGDVAAGSNPGMSFNASAAVQSATELEGIKQSGEVAATGESGSGGGEVADPGGKKSDDDGGTPTDPLAYLRLLIKKQREATEVSAVEAAARMAVLAQEGVAGYELVSENEGNKAAAVEASEQSQVASRKEGNVQQKAMAIIGAVIATGLAVIKSLATMGVPAGIPFAIAAGAMGAVQIATIAAAATGGRITEMGVDVSSGGKLRGAGTGTSDSISAVLSNGEYVINAAQTQKYSGVLAAINSGMSEEVIMSRLERRRDIAGFATGGMAVMSGKVSTYSPSDSKSSGEAASTYNTTNINISGNVDQRAIDQIRNVISKSPKHVESATAQGTRNITGLRRPKGR